ncbi:hypothetical protein [Streptomyces sp. CA-106131]|uniref:hypothetical protein n=1 Tax=Streptomyces sp. CA-106131 TaxID=3240045 RepID=UPI003D93B877
MTTPTPADIAPVRSRNTATLARIAVERLITALADSVTDDDAPIDLESVAQCAELVRQAAALTAAQADHIRALTERQKESTR